MEGACCFVLGIITIFNCPTKLEAAALANGNITSSAKSDSC